MKTKQLRDDWEVLAKFFPKGWEDKASELGALVRKRKINSAQVLLRILLIHLADGKSLRATAAYAYEANICDINDVALLHRLKASGEWLRWMCLELLCEFHSKDYPEKFESKFRIRLIDGSVVNEPGSTGTDWRIHYSLQLNNLVCDTFKITSPKIGESFKLFSIEDGDLLVGDRCYCTRKGIIHVLENGGNVLVRFHSTNLPLFTHRGKPFSVLEKLRSLNKCAQGDWNVWFRDPNDNTLVKGRLCSIRKSKEAIELAMKKILQEASKKGRKVRPETLEYAEYVIIFTTVNRHVFKKKEVLILYRGRWQVELIFKRLKSIVGVGHLPKKDPESCIAWLYGKMFVALLVERLYREADFFSPWGYPI